MKSKVKVKENSVPYATIEQPVNCPKVQFKDISAKSIGLLFFIISSDTSISAEALATTLLEGESAIATGLKELRNLGFLELDIALLNGLDQFPGADKEYDELRMH
jgi:hypothetical protein